MNGLICPDSVPGFLNFFDFSIAPPLLFYAYVPVVFVALLLGLFIFIKSKDRLVAWLLFSISILFSLWVLLAIITWIAVHVNVVQLSWNILTVVEILIYISFIYFIYAFVNKKDLKIRSKVLLFLFTLPVFGSLFFLKESFDLLNCESLFSPIWYYIYAFEILSIFVVVFICLKKILSKNPADIILRKQTGLILFGSVLFLSIFSVTNIFGDLMLTYEINLVGPIGMILFLVFLSYLIVRFKTFDVKLIGAQALVWSMIILIGSQFFFIQSNVNMVLNSITLVLSAWVGLMIVRGVKNEILQREQVERLAKSLEITANKLEASNLSLQDANEHLKELDNMKSEFVSLATHQIRGPLSAIKGYVSMMQDGDFGPKPERWDEPLKVIFTSVDSLSKMVTDFLDVSRIDLGQMKYEFSEFDFRDLVSEVITELKPNIEAKGLELRLKITDLVCPVKIDRTKIKQVINNLVDNSSKYTKTGWMEVSVERKNGHILFAVKDSGVGISPKTMSVLFQRFSRASDANSSNILGTGLGLYVAKKMVEAHNGRIWAESEGALKGSQFYVEIPSL